MRGTAADAVDHVQRPLARGALQARRKLLIYGGRIISGVRGTTSGDHCRQDGVEVPRGVRRVESRLMVGDASELCMRGLV